MPRQVHFVPSQETSEALADLADRDGVPPHRRVFDIVRNYVFAPPEHLPRGFGVSRRVSLSLLDQRGKARDRLGREVTRATVDEAAKRYELPPAGSQVPANSMVIPIGRVLSDLLPRAIAYTEVVDLAGLAERNPPWSDLPSFIAFLVTEEVAKKQSELEAKETDEDASRLPFPTKP